MTSIKSRTRTCPTPRRRTEGTTNNTPNTCRAELMLQNPAHSAVAVLFAGRHGALRGRLFATMLGGAFPGVPAGSSPSPAVASPRGDCRIARWDVERLREVER